MATPKRTSSTRRTTRRRTTRSRTTPSRTTPSRTTRSRTTRSRTRRRSTSLAYRRRRPRLATTLGGAAALVLIAAFIRLSLQWRVILVAAVVTLLVAWFLWSRRGDISDEMRAQRQDEPEADQQQAQQQSPQDQEEPT